MNNRRSFLQSLALGIAAAPSILKAATTYQRTWHVPPGKLIAIPNPEWVTAPYELAYLMGLGPTGEPVICQRGLETYQNGFICRPDLKEHTKLNEPWPLRYKQIDGDPVPPFIQIRVPA